ncbi:hypothetical protein AVEN_96279-1 [Araneus ventricosus]|uniref:Uncharacterized protein n=1 Tax=Araneus ventricosus TaxID=182803 RepID=A0A4Y2P695_ARAVE|nr:hypothetical protein AVEN_96279-1 [Araneus ventricosus]
MMKKDVRDDELNDRMDAYESADAFVRPDGHNHLELDYLIAKRIEYVDWKENTSEEQKTSGFTSKSNLTCANSW